MQKRNINVVVGGGTMQPVIGNANMQSLSIGLELTFLPKRPHSRWQEWRDLEKAKQETDLFNVALWCTDAVLSLEQYEGGVPASSLIWGKADIFRSRQLSKEVQPHDAWCLEVNNEPFCSDDITTEGTVPYKALGQVYKTAADQGLFPCIMRRKRDGTLVEFPNGGGHQHVQIDFWSEGAQFLPKLYMLERGLCVDFCNHPWIRWLFSQWSDTLNSAVAMNLADLKELAKAVRNVKPLHRKAWREKGADAYAHDRGLQCHSIKQRVAYTQKPVKPTLEFRFFDMPRTIEELSLHTRFLSAWINSHIDKVNVAENGITDDSQLNHFTLTARHYERLTRDMDFAKGEIGRFLGEIGLDCEIYLDAFFERCYARRMKYGKAL